MTKPINGAIYDQHQAAFTNVSAFVIAKNGERVATIAFKFPRDGAGRLYAYVHWLGLPMVRGFANGYGYDKRSAACSSAAGRMIAGKEVAEADHISFRAFTGALKMDDGNYWDRRLRDAGFDVWQAV
jgi:hypothetical protein